MTKNSSPPSLDLTHVSHHDVPAPHADLPLLRLSTLRSPTGVERIQVNLGVETGEGLADGALNRIRIALISRK